MTERFVGAELEPVVETCDTARMGLGEPGLPRRFLWRGEMVEITRVLRVWRETGPCRHGSDERYVRKHWYQVATLAHGTMKLYFDRQARRGGKKARWWLFSMDDSPLQR